MAKVDVPQDLGELYACLVIGKRADILCLLVSCGFSCFISPYERECNRLVYQG